MFFEELLLAGVCMALGWLGGALFSWSTSRNVRRLEIDLEDLLTALLTELRKRAAKERWSLTDELKHAQAVAQAPAKAPTVQEWRWGRGIKDR
jgi:hypothetical protein